MHACMHPSFQPLRMRSQISEYRNFRPKAAILSLNGVTRYPMVDKDADELVLPLDADVTSKSEDQQQAYEVKYNGMHVGEETSQSIQEIL